jgi:hypothetical protein
MSREMRRRMNPAGLTAAAAAAAAGGGALVVDLHIATAVWRHFRVHGRSIRDCRLVSYNARAMSRTMFFMHININRRCYNDSKHILLHAAYIYNTLSDF